MASPKGIPLYDRAGTPQPEFNRRILAWLKEEQAVVGHKPPAAFAPLRAIYDATLASVLAQRDDQPRARWETHRTVLSNLTRLTADFDLAPTLAQRLTLDPINQRGFRTALSQGQAKNTGENFTNAIVYALADVLAEQDEILVDKGLPRCLHDLVTLSKTFVGSACGTRQITLPIEADLCIWRRSNPADAIILSGKTRLKEVFHIGTMWKLLFDMLTDPYCLSKWELTIDPRDLDMLYVFATADNIPAGGTNTQGCDVERDQVRNLIAMDAAFFDYVFVSKQGIPHVSPSLNWRRGHPREALFHEMGCLLDLVEQKFELLGPVPR